MKRILFVIFLSALLMVTLTAIAAANVVVIPLKSSSKAVGNAPPPKTGQSRCTYYFGFWFWDLTCNHSFRPPGQDGELKLGTAWPNPRFTDNTDGTVTDNLTGLIWLKNANCTTFYSGDPTGNNYRNWSEALSSAYQLEGGYCGLTDGSSAGDWRVPNKNELNSLITSAYSHPALSNDAGTGRWAEDSTSSFTGVILYNYWSSTNYAGFVGGAWFVSLTYGDVNHTDDKSQAYFVWPVRN